MKLILQIALGVFLAELAMHTVTDLEVRYGLAHAPAALPSAPAQLQPPPQVPASGQPATQQSAHRGVELSTHEHHIAPTNLGCSHEEINGKAYNCCLESEKDPSVRSCTAIPAH
jgi:hypothetical protein